MGISNIDWSRQYDKLQNDVCCYFGLQLQVSTQMGLLFMFEGMEINNSEDIKNGVCNIGNTHNVETQIEHSQQLQKIQSSAPFSNPSLSNHSGCGGNYSVTSMCNTVNCCANEDNYLNNISNTGAISALNNFTNTHKDASHPQMQLSNVLTSNRDDINGNINNHDTLTTVDGGVTTSTTFKEIFSLPTAAPLCVVSSSTPKSITNVGATSFNDNESMISACNSLNSGLGGIGSKFVGFDIVDRQCNNISNINMCTVGNIDTNTVDDTGSMCSVWQPTSLTSGGANNTVFGNVDNMTSVGNINGAVDQYPNVPARGGKHTGSLLACRNDNEPYCSYNRSLNLLKFGEKTK